jgi:hypothetical protein
MKNLNNFFKFLSIVIFLNATISNAQVVIGGTSLDSGAIFQLEADDKGLMIPKVALTSRNDATTITPGNVEGLWVYNTATAGSGNDRVSPGFYFWDSSKWVKIYDEGYAVQFEQTQTRRSENNIATYDLPGLNQNIVAPYSGTYEIHVTGYIACPNALSSGGYEAMVMGSYMLLIDNVVVAESMVSSSTKRAPGAFQALGQQTSIVYHAELDAGTTYNFKVRTRQWRQVNVQSGSLGGIYPGNYAFWGISSAPYNGNQIPAIDNAQDAYLTITLLRQY